MSAEDFLIAYGRAREEAFAGALEASPFASALLAYIKGSKAQWEGTATELLDDVTGSVKDDRRYSKSWPTTGRGVTGALTRYAAALRREGVQITHHPRNNRKRLLTIEIIKMGRTPSQPSPTSPDGLRPSPSGELSPDRRQQNSMSGRRNDDRDGCDDVSPTPPEGGGRADSRDDLGGGGADTPGYRVEML